VDQAIPARALESIVSAVDAEWGRTVDLEA
jgi:hypothetical protein